MTEQNIFCARVATELSGIQDKSKQRIKAQYYLIIGCTGVNKNLIDIALGYGADMLSPDDRGKTPVEILSQAEKLKASKTKPQTVKKVDPNLKPVRRSDVKETKDAKGKVPLRKV